jgi:hypothetical protein
MRVREAARDVRLFAEPEGGRADLSELMACSLEADAAVERAEETARQWLTLAG